MSLAEMSHRRLNPLTGEWVLVSPHRTKRPWLGQKESPEPETRPAHDPDCYLCPGNKRAQGQQNPPYEKTFVFANDFSALLPQTSEDVAVVKDGLLVAEPETGYCRVVCFTPRHDLSLPRMTLPDVTEVVKTWVAEYQSLAAKPDVHYVQIFENRGSMMGCSNPHPHAQIWANRCIPNIPLQESRRQEEYLLEHDRCLLCRYLSQELDRQERVVLQNDAFVALVPFWAIWPFEIMILPRRHLASIDQMSAVEQTGLADIMIRMGIRYDNLFQTSFPYSMGIHQKPTDDGEHPAWHFHLHYYPPLLRSQTVRKFMVGYEMMAMAQRDITPEESAERLRDLLNIHYLD